MVTRPTRRARREMSRGREGSAGAGFGAAGGFLAFTAFLSPAAAGGAPSEAAAPHAAAAAAAGEEEEKAAAAAAHGSISISCPLRILHGARDDVVPLSVSEDLVHQLAGGDVALTIVKDGDHRLSTSRDLELLEGAVFQVYCQLMRRQHH